MLRKPGSCGVIGFAFVAFLAHAQAPSQVGPSQAAPPRPKPIDIGAREAPLSDAERADLDRAVTKHNYAAEKAVIDRAMTEHPDSFELLIMAGRLGYLEKTRRTRPMPWRARTRSSRSAIPIA